MSNNEDPKASAQMRGDLQEAIFVGTLKVYNSL
jgi:hypothetical protein